MVKELSEEEVESLKDLEKNFVSYVKRYRKRKERELLEGKRAELEKELSEPEDYLEGCHKSEIDDVMINIQFCGAKIMVLRSILENEQKR